MTAQREIIFGQPYLGAEEEQLVTEVLRSGWIGQGSLVSEFERRLGEYVGAAETVAVSSCTAALQLSLIALEVGPGDEVITTPFTFAATLDAILEAGATPVLCDIDRATLCLAPAAVEAALTEKTRAVMPVHFGGRPLDTAGYQALADRHDLWVIEDAAHAIGAVADGNLVGGSGHPRLLSCFSFYPNKNLASAEGGAVCLADPRVAAEVKHLRQHGLDIDAWDRYRSPEYRPSLAVTRGFKANWTDLQAAIALPQLTRLEGFLATRQHLAAVYDRLLAVEGAQPVDRGPHDLSSRHALHLYQVALDDPSRRNHVVGELRREGIGAAVHYIGLNHHPHFKGDFAGEFPNSDWASEALISLPLHPGLAEGELARVAEALAESLA
jgi:UDP-4-amino-4-deoxy-L-arabinose-oxoglutarate aminotransferase